MAISRNYLKMLAIFGDFDTFHWRFEKKSSGHTDSSSNLNLNQIKSAKYMVLKESTIQRIILGTQNGNYKCLPKNGNGN